MFKMENQNRIRTVEHSFGPSGKPLAHPDRVLIGEGHLMKQSRRGPQPKVFFLFNDMLVYGSIIFKGRWHKNQKIIPLEDIELEDLEDGFQRKNQWLIRTPRKSFYVSAASQEEKQAWIDHMEVCRAQLLQTSSCRPSSTFAVTWIPDPSSAICMRCSRKFTMIQRRHHCRKCGFLVCGYCSKKRAIIGHIHLTKRQRVCVKCHDSLKIITQRENEEGTRLRGDSSGKSSDEDEHSTFEEKYEDEMEEDFDPGHWMDPQMDSFSPYVYLKPKLRDMCPSV